MKIPMRAKKAWCVACFGLPVLCESGAAQTPDLLLQTTGSGSLMTDFRSLEVVTGPGILRFDLGFATAEENASAPFFDSVTLSLEGISAAATTIFATLDRSGAYWAPVVPGGISLDPLSLVYEEIPFPDFGLNLPNQRAYSFTAPIPPELVGQNLKFRIDLYDNQNSVNSAAFVDSIAVVPEPSTIGLATAVALIAAAFVSRCNRRDQ